MTARRTGRRLRILVLLEEFESHLRALWSTVDALLALGNEVRVAAAPKLADKIGRKYGFPYAAAGVAWADERAAARLAAALDRGNDSFCRLLFRDYLAGPHLAATADELLRLTENWRPDYIVSDITHFAASLLAEKIGVQNLQFNNGWADIFSAENDFLRETMTPHRIALGLSEIAPTMEPRPIFDPTPAGLLLGDIPGLEIVRYQPENPRGNGAVLPRWAADLPDGFIYLSLGSILTRSAAFKPLLERHYSRLIDALTLLREYTSVVSLGPQLRRSFAPRPNIRFETWVPQELLMQAGVALFITHGGASSIRDALLAKVRMLFAPISSDQFGNAASCARLGLGEVIAADASAEEIAALIRAALTAPKSGATALHWQRRSLMLPPIGKLLPAYLTDRDSA